MAGRRHLFWQLYSSFLLITLGVLLGTAWYAEHSLVRLYRNQMAADLESRARLFARNLPATLDPEGTVDALCKDLAKLTLTRITVVLPDGRVAGDSAESPSAMDNHRERPEVAAALGGSIGQSIRHSDTLNRTLMYLAIPVLQDQHVVAVVRAALPLAVVDAPLDDFLRRVAFGVLAVAAVFAVVAYLLSRRISRPLEQMRQVSEQFAQGDLAARVPVPHTEELGSLARTMNQMAAQLDARMKEVAAQGNEQRAVLFNMVEGVMAFDIAQRVLHVNPAACRLLGLNSAAVRGRHLLETVRNIELQEFITALAQTAESLEREIVLRDQGERVIQLHGVALKDGEGKGIGALVVMHDITRLKRLESLRRDFVANASHELKTPITALKGGLETLLDGALENPVEARHFLEMMARQTNRLELLVSDLLILSCLEHEAEREGIELSPDSIHDVLARAVQTYTARAEAKGILLVMDCPGTLAAPVNAVLLEQAVGNLLDNAIKYSPEETRVSVTALSREPDGIEIRVSDQGPGIDKRHQDRIFERFYRVDQARSRAMGGTGLGLAIVKHIILAHHGRVAIESQPGQGSTFSLFIPASADKPGVT